MHYIVTHYVAITSKLVLWTSLLLLIVGVAACGGKPTPPHHEGPTGDELVTKMKKAVKAVNKTHFTVEFQIGSVKGPIKGTVEFWGERPDNMRAEVVSELSSIDGIVAVSNSQKGWAYNPKEKLAIVSDQSQYKSQLRDQPELRSILDFAEKMVDRGFDNTESINLGAEQVNGRDTYKVQVTYGESSDPELDLEDVTAIFWIDQQTFLPQRVEITIKRDALIVSGFVVLQGDIAKNQAIDALQFTFSFPKGATVLDMSELPELPTFSDLPPVQ